MTSPVTLQACNPPFSETECDYIRSEVFVHLIPALEDTLNKAKIWEALARQKCFFNGIDHIVQVQCITCSRLSVRGIDLLSSCLVVLRSAKLSHLQRH